MTGPMIKLSTFEPPVRRTIQGDGILLGMPMVFVRTHGCDFSCSWCDTKDSWREGSVSEDVTPAELADRIVDEARGTYWLSFTGGNPMLHAEGLYQTALHLSRLQAWGGLIETQASFFDDRVNALIAHSPFHEFLLSLSPKLHDWRENVIDQMIRAVQARPKKGRVQIKVVVTSKEDCLTAISKFRAIHSAFYRYSVVSNREDREISFILLPEYSLGRKNVETAIAAVGEFYSERRSFDIRVIPQLHKLSLFVP